MKKAGWTILVLASLSFLGCVGAGRNPFGPTFWMAIGIFLIYRANRKKQEEKDKEEWRNEK